jgi:hypothetical protein
MPYQANLAQYPSTYKSYDNFIGSPINVEPVIPDIKRDDHLCVVSTPPGPITREYSDAEVLKIIEYQDFDGSFTFSTTQEANNLLGHEFQLVLHALQATFSFHASLLEYTIVTVTFLEEHPGFAKYRKLLYPTVKKAKAYIRDMVRSKTRRRQAYSAAKEELQLGSPADSKTNDGKHLEQQTTKHTHEVYPPEDQYSPISHAPVGPDSDSNNKGQSDRMMLAEMMGYKNPGRSARHKHKEKSKSHKNKRG